MGIEIGKINKTLVTDEEQRTGLPLGRLSKRNPNWVAALGFDDMPVAFSSDPEARKVDGDLWLIGVGTNGKAVDVVRYDPDNPERIVDSVAGLGAYTYLSDARSGAAIKGDDEQVIIRHDKCRDTKIVKSLLVGNVYKPNIDWGMVPNAYMRIFPEGVSDREGNILIPDQANAIKSVKLTDKGTGARCIIFGTDNWVGPGPLDWTFDVNPQLVPEGIESLLASLDITFN